MAVYRGKWCFIHWMSVMIVFFSDRMPTIKNRVLLCMFWNRKIITNGDWRLVYQKGRPSRPMRTSATQCRWCSQMKTDPGDSITKTWPFPLRIPSRSGCHGLFWEGKHPPIEFILQGPVPVPQGYIAKAHEFRLVFTSLQMWDFLRPQSHKWNSHET